MNSLNSVLIEGVVERAPVLSRTPHGALVCFFSIASTRTFKLDNELQKEVSYFDVEVWAKLAVRCVETMRQGDHVRVVGRLHQDRWTMQNNEPRSRVTIVAEHIDNRAGMAV